MVALELETAVLGASADAEPPLEVPGQRFYVDAGAEAVDHGHGFAVAALLDRDVEPGPLVADRVQGIAGKEVVGRG
jgi:hypothetical protein